MALALSERRRALTVERPLSLASFTSAQYGARVAVGTTVGGGGGVSVGAGSAVGGTEVALGTTKGGYVGVAAG